MDLNKQDTHATEAITIDEHATDHGIGEDCFLQGDGCSIPFFKTLLLWTCGNLKMCPSTDTRLGDMDTYIAECPGISITREHLEAFVSHLRPYAQPDYEKVYKDVNNILPLSVHMECTFVLKLCTTVVQCAAKQFLYNVLHDRKCTTYKFTKSCDELLKLVALFDVFNRVEIFNEDVCRFALSFGGTRFITSLSKESLLAIFENEVLLGGGKYHVPHRKSQTYETEDSEPRGWCNY